MFYAQSTAACAYLFHADGGKHRARLMKYVDDYYQGRGKELDLEAAFGMKAEELGKQVVEYARR